MYTARVLKVIKRFACKPNYLVAQCSRNFSRNLKCETSTTSKFHQIRYLTAASNNLRKEEKSPQTYEVTFIKKNGDKIKVSGKEGDSLLDVVINNNLDFDGYGACEGTLTCSTCHVILKKEDYDKLPDGPTEEELDMLDLAFELTDTSRLGCQIVLSKDLDGLEVKLPSTINDARE